VHGSGAVVQNEIAGAAHTFKWMCSPLCWDRPATAFWEPREIDVLRRLHGVPQRGAGILFRCERYFLISLPISMTSERPDHSPAIQNAARRESSQPVILGVPGTAKVPTIVWRRHPRATAIRSDSSQSDTTNRPRLPAPPLVSATADGSVGWVVHALCRSRHSGQGTTAGSEPPRQGTAGVPHRLTRPQPSVLR
jgi:hypothetical protein